MVYVPMDSAVMVPTRAIEPVDNRLRLVTYNIRKGKGADGRSAMLARLGPALGVHNPDLLLCQEVFHCRQTGLSQSANLAEALSLESYYGANKFRRVGHHGNTTFTRLAVQGFKNHDISTNFIERRGALYVLGLLLALMAYVPLLNILAPVVFGLAFIRYLLGALIEVRYSAHAKKELGHGNGRA
jgi:hypothetical protein